MRLLRLCLVLVGILAPILYAHARFIRADLVKVPVARLVDNMERMILKKPKDVNLYFNLARVHAMAFAQKTDSTKVWRNKEERGSWFGYTPKAVPFAKKSKKATTEAEKNAAAQHLEKALHCYGKVLKLSPKHLPASLGRAWLFEQMGKKEQAVKGYRKIIDSAWATEGKLRRGRLGGNYITAETAGYLIPLLDKTNDAKEIETLKARVAKLKRLPRPITPVAIPLRGGLKVDDILNRNGKVKFDADGSGLRKSWTWIRPSAGWLVYDRRGDRKITSGLQLFGNVTFWLFWDNGYQAMATLDNNGDGFLSGPELNGLAIWCDVNSNGVSEASEVKSLAAHGIIKLSCQFSEQTSKDCAAFSRQGVWFRNGTVRPTFDVILRQRQ